MRYHSLKRDNEWPRRLASRLQWWHNSCVNWKIYNFKLLISYKCMCYVLMDYTCVWLRLRAFCRCKHSAVTAQHTLAMLSSSYEVCALIQFSSAFSSPPQFNISCFSVFCSESLESINCQYSWNQVTSHFQTSSKDILFHPAHLFSAVHLA